jgi:hypothetical protein
VLHVLGLVPEEGNVAGQVLEDLDLLSHKGAPPVHHAAGDHLVHLRGCGVGEGGEERAGGKRALERWSGAEGFRCTGGEVQREVQEEGLK